MCALILLAVEFFVARSNWLVEQFPRSKLGVINALESRVIEGSHPQIVCLGNSRLRDGISPRLIERELGLPTQTVLNLALPGGMPYHSLIMYRRNRETLRQAKILIVDFEYRYFGFLPQPDARVAQFATHEDRLRMFSGRKLVAVMASSLWRTLGLRDYIRGFSKILKRRKQLALADDGRVMWRHVERDQHIDMEADFIKRGMNYASDRLDFAHVEELRRLIAMARHDGLKVVLLHLPLRTGFVRYLKGTYPGNYEKFRAEFDRLDFNVELIIDWEKGSDIGLLDEESYYDYGHFTDEGCSRMSRMVTARIRPLVTPATNKESASDN